MEALRRKINRLCDYDYNTHGAYFVTICTQNRRKILSEIVGDGFPVLKPCGRIAEEIIQQIHEKYPAVSVDKYVIMPDHIHILLMIERKEGTGDPSPTLGNIIGWYKYRVTKQINAHYDQQGEKIFQRSYYDHVIRNRQDYDDVWQYIENNPCKWIIEQQKKPDT